MGIRTSKIGYKLWLRVSFIFLILFAALYWLNNFTIQSVYYESKKSELLNAAAQFDKDLPTEKELEGYLKHFNESGDITVISLNLFENEATFNESLFWKLTAEKTAISKIWFVEDRLENVREGRRVFTTFDQGKAKNKYLSYMFKYEDKAILIMVSIVDEQELISLLNKYLPFIFMGVFVVALLLMWQVSQRLTRPIQALQDLSVDISNQSYRQIELNTGDELEELGNYLNQMSRELEQFHQSLSDKNELLKETIQGMSHEMKTPLALINAYAAGIRDGVKMENSAEIIMDQVGALNLLIDQMLNLAKYEKEVYSLERINLVTLTEAIVSAYPEQLVENGLKFNKCFEQDIYIIGDADKMGVVIQNLVSNAVKYATQPNISICIYKDKDSQKPVWCIQNAASDIKKEDFERLEEPFFVVDKSRNRLTTGTGIGLSLVATILKKHGFQYEKAMQSGSFVFKINF